MASVQPGALAPSPDVTNKQTPKLEDHHFVAVLNCLFHVFEATSISEGCSSILKLRTNHALVTGADLSWMKRMERGHFINFAKQSFKHQI
jgi:hypothetical protein